MLHFRVSNSIYQSISFKFPLITLLDFRLYYLSLFNSTLSNKLISIEHKYVYKHMRGTQMRSQLASESLQRQCISVIYVLVALVTFSFIKGKLSPKHKRLKGAVVETPQYKKKRKTLHEFV